MGQNECLDLFIVLRSEMAPKEFHIGGRASGNLTPEACDFVAATIHDLFWPEMFVDYRTNHALSPFSDWLEDQLVELYEVNEQIDEILNLFSIINAHRQGRKFILNADIASLFGIEEKSKIGITDLQAIHTLAPKYKHLCFVETSETNVIDQALCDIYGIPIENKDERKDVIISFLSSTPSILLDQIENSADVVLMQIGKNDLIIDMEGLSSIENKTREIIQIGPKNSPASDNYYLIKTYASSNCNHLILKYYQSLQTFLRGEEVGEWVFRHFEKPKEERVKLRIDAYDVEELWSLFPIDYLPFGYERSFNVRATILGNAPDNHQSPQLFPIYLLNNNMDDTVFIKSYSEYMHYIKKYMSGNKNSELLLYFEGNTRMIPLNDPSLERILLKAALTLLLSSSDIKRQFYWLPLTKYDGAINIPTKQEARYRLVEWLGKHHPESIEAWNRYCATEFHLSISQDSTLGENAYVYFKRGAQNYDLEDHFYAILIDSPTTDDKMNLVGWSQNNAEDKKEYRKQPIRNLMLAALGINREQFKYIQKLNRADKDEQ